MTGTPAPYGSRMVFSRQFDEYLLEIYRSDHSRKLYTHLYLKRGAKPVGMYRRSHSLAREAGFSSADYWAIFEESENCSVVE